ncbi:acyl-CoA dehydrogenase [Streptomyces sp. ADMS]|uniref:acyl-CoA dehydrogenase family protein n=1 Tax=Streptomyces sp. ADMS TaxID=3071415 RepID=UPI00296ED2A6|nr:acyl-CoA dehydrogenase [Streptomyces sp. ADMS]MDW4908754.1 acyl-CoA dehydrogenase [Streptomyces sp. ADMS]
MTTETRTPHPALDQEAITSLLFRDGPDGNEVHGRWRKAVSKELFRYRPGLGTQQRWQLAYERLRALNDEVPSPEHLANDPRGLAALHEWTCPVDGATVTVAGIHYNLFLGSVVDDQVSPSRELTDFTTMTRIGTFLCTERAHGNDVPALETVARYDRERDEFDLHTPHPGAQKYMPNTSSAGGPKTAVVAARLIVDDKNLGAFLFLTPLSDEFGTLPGITVTLLPERVGTSIDHCATNFDHVRLPRTALLQGAHGQLLPDGSLVSSVGSPRKRFLHAISRVTAGKLCMSASGLGVARTALAVAVRYSYTRHISGPVAGQRVPLAAHRSHCSRLLALTATAYAMTFLHRAATERWVTHEPEERADAERMVAVTKAWITWQAREIAAESRERCGARGLFPVNGLADMAANMDGGITAEGDNLAICCKAGAEMIFGHDLAEEPVRPTGDEPLTDPGLLRRALTTAERYWHLAARRDLRGGDGGDALGRWNNASDAALSLVEVFTVGQAADALLAACARVSDPLTRAVLEDLSALFLLRQVSARGGLLLAEQALTAEQMRALPETLHTLTTRLAPHLGTLTQAFDVPEEHLSSLPMLSGV